MKKYTITTTDFTDTYARTSKNSIQFENSCVVSNISDIPKEKSKYNIKNWENELITIYLPSIIENGQTLTVNATSRRLYNMNPQRLSIDHFGVSDYWYIILAMNNYTSVYDFKNFVNILLLPNISYIDSLITDIERKRSKV